MNAEYTVVLEEWEERGLVLPGWTVECDAGDGTYRLGFTVAGGERRYSFTEAEFGQYLLGAVDVAPGAAGPMSLALAEEMRAEQAGGERWG